MLEVSEKEPDFPSGAAMAGELLADRLARGPVPPDAALRYAIEIGSVLNRAHARGRIHGAVSPCSILIANDAAVLVKPPAEPDERAARYRSPEQVRGQPAGERSDIFAFGAVLYEMLAGEPAFGGTGEDLDRAILEEAPAALMAKAAIPAAMEGVIASCLEKDPGRRRQRVLNAVTELKLSARSLPAAEVLRARRIRPLFLPSEAAPPVVPARAAHAAARPDYVVVAPPRDGSGRRLTILALALLFVGTGLAAGVFLLSRRPAPRPIHFTVPPPENTSYPGAPSVSPDGRLLTFSALGPNGARMLWLRPLDADTAGPIPGTEGAFEPFWSPDSQSIGFFANRALKKVKIPDGPVQTLCNAGMAAGGGSWNRDGVILFAPGIAGALFRVPSGGGAPQPVSKLAESERAHLWPQFLPDGAHFIYFALTNLDATTGVYAGALDGSTVQRIIGSQTNAVYSEGDSDARNGYLIFLRDRALSAQRFNTARLALEGNPSDLAQNVNGVMSMSLTPVSVSNNSVLVYQSLGDPTRQLLWMDRSGKQLAAVDKPGEWAPPRISPDGRRAVAPWIPPGQNKANLWLLDEAGVSSRFTDAPVHQGSPVWSPDGSRVVFFENRNNQYDLVAKGSEPGARTETLYSNSLPKYPTDWSRSGRYILFGVVSPGTRADIWTFSMTDRRATPILTTVYAEAYGSISPDEKWLAYQTDESGAPEVYVQPFDPATSITQRRWQISSSGGSLPRWRADGEELFYMAPDGGLMAVPTSSDGNDFQCGKPQMLFQTRPLPKAPWNVYDVSPDGQRFLVNVPLEWSISAPIRVVVNWNDKLKS